MRAASIIPVMRDLCTAAALLAAVAALPSCQPEQLGQCNLDEATTLVFDGAGNPAYAGQALVQESCSGCHSALATGAVRRGAPAGFDFDMVGSRGTDSTMGDSESLDRLRGARQTMFDERFAIFETVESGAMPPGEVGRQAYAPVGYVFEDGSPLPTIETGPGRGILRAWLSCGAPVVAVTGDDGEPGTSCTGPADLLPEGASEDAERKFACVTRQSCDVDDASWSTIFADIIVPQCAGCHSTGVVDFTSTSQLDLCGAPDGMGCDPQVAYDAMVGVASAGEECVGGPQRVVPNDPDGSLLMHKLEGVDASGGAVCGDPMPIPTLLSSCQLDIIRAWIEAGAPAD